MPSRIRDFTVPSGKPTCSAISVDLRLAERREVGEVNQPPLFGGKLFETCSHDRGPLRRQTGLFGILPGIGNRTIHEFRRPRAAALGRAQPVDRPAPADGDHPGNHRAAIQRVTAGAAPDLEIDFQRDVFGQRGIAQEADGDAINHAAGSVVQLRKGVVVALRDFANEFRQPLAWIVELPRRPSWHDSDHTMWI